MVPAAFLVSLISGVLTKRSIWIIALAVIAIAVAIPTIWIPYFEAAAMVGLFTAAICALPALAGTALGRWFRNKRTT
jgi:hypothetical protein